MRPCLSLSSPLTAFRRGAALLPLLRKYTDLSLIFAANDKCWDLGDCCSNPPASGPGGVRICNCVALTHPVKPKLQKTFQTKHVCNSRCIDRG